EERHHDDRFRPRSRAQRGQEPHGGHLPGGAGPFQADHDDHNGCAYGDSAHSSRIRRRSRVEKIPWSGHCRRIIGVPAVDTLHYTGNLLLFRPGPETAQGEINRITSSWFPLRTGFQEAEMPASVLSGVTRTTLAVILIGVLITACFWIMRPFLYAIIWAAMIVIATWPLLISLQSLFGGRRWAAVLIMTLLLLCILFIPLTVVVMMIIDKAQELFVAGNTYLGSIKVPVPPDWVHRI